MATSPFITSIWPHVLQASQATGIDPRIIAAQAALESGYGRHAPGNNLFGIKSHGQSGGNTLATTEVVNGQPVRTSASFRAYDSPADSVMGYADFINANPRYGPLKRAQGLDAQLAALQASGYATDPNYSQKVGSIARSIDGVTSAPLPDVLSPEAADFVRNNPQPGGYGEGIERMVSGPANPASNPPGILPAGPTGGGILANAGSWFGGTRQDADAVNSLLSGDQKSPLQRLGDALKELGRNQPSGARPPAFPGGPTQAQATGLLELLGSPTMGSILSKRRTQGILS